MASCAAAADATTSHYRRARCHRIHVVLHRALAQALRWEWLWVNPASTASPPSCEPAPDLSPQSRRGRPAPLSRRAVSIPISTPSWRWLSRQEPDEASSVRCVGATSISSEVRSDSFEHSWMRKGGPVLRPTKTGRTYRVNLDADCLEVLTQHFDRAKERAQRSGVRHRSLRASSSSEDRPETPWPPNWVTKQFITYRRVAKVNCRLHDLRHFMATTMLTAGIPITTVSARLSHARTSTTLNVYAHAVPGGDDVAAEVLGGILHNARCALKSRRQPVAS